MKIKKQSLYCNINRTNRTKLQEFCFDLTHSIVRLYLLELSEWEVFPTLLIEYGDEDFPSNINKRVLEYTSNIIHETGRFNYVSSKPLHTSPLAFFHFYHVDLFNIGYRAHWTNLNSNNFLTIVNKLINSLDYPLFNHKQNWSDCSLLAWHAIRKKPKYLLLKVIHLYLCVIL